MKINNIVESRDMCNVCGQTPCNCTHLTESAGGIGRQIKALYQKIYNAGDDAIEFMYYDSPIFAQYWDEYEGDLDSIIAEVDPSELQIIYDELVSAVEDQGLEEGVGKDMATLGGIATLGIAGGLAGNYADQQQPKVEIGGKVAFVEPTHSRVPDSAMTLTGKDGKTYRVWATKGTVQSPHRYHAVPVEGVKEGGEKWIKLPNGNYRNLYTGVQASRIPKEPKRTKKAHPDYSDHEKQLISKMSDAEKVDKGWRNPDVDEGYDKWGWHTSLTNGEFMPTKYGNKAYVYLHDLDNESPRGGPQLVTVNKPTVAKRLAKQFGGRVVKTDLNTYRVVKPAEQGVAEGGRGSGRPVSGTWDPTSGKVGRVEKTSTGIRHHADSSRYGGTEPDDEDDRLLSKAQIHRLDKATEPVDESYDRILDAVSTVNEEVLEHALHELVEAVAATAQPAAQQTDVAARKAAAPYGYNTQTGKPNPAPAATTPAAPAPAQPAAQQPAADPVQQKADQMQQKLLDKMGARFGLAPGSSMEQVQAAQQAHLDKNDPTAAAQYKQNMANIDAGNTAANKPVQLAPTQPAAAPQTMQQQDPNFAAGLAAQKAGGSPIDIMLAQPNIANNQKLVDAIGSVYGLPAGSTVDQVKAAANGKPAAPAQPTAPAVAEGKAKKLERPEADYGDDYQAMVGRLKQLAGAGPLKTVYDPQKRVYKNVPQAVQPKKEK